MITFNYISKYDFYMDKEAVDLCNAINSLPGLKTSQSCCGHNKEPFRIYFDILPYQSNEGLFFLTRCVDKRYWKYGNKWSISLCVGDRFDKILPIAFVLSSECKGEEAYDQSIDLVKNMQRHLNHASFIKGYNINLCKFNLKEL